MSTIGDPRPARDESKAGDTRQAREEGKAGDWRQAREAVPSGGATTPPSGSDMPGPGAIT